MWRQLSHVGQAQLWWKAQETPVAAHQQRLSRKNEPTWTLQDSPAGPVTATCVVVHLLAAYPGTSPCSLPLTGAGHVLRQRLAVAVESREAGSLGWNPHCGNL